ncbi:hypothetical protein ACIBCM_05485 [Streptomyces sp. NPDC051018]|uniref:hypothetical protein n=1 Tax=Streptomyces sp. NPDC051018 TaxID=3365639 RepID=UPI0037ADA281
MTNRHLRTAVVTTAALTAGLLMTACQSGSGDDTSGKKAAAPAAEADKASDSGKAKGVSGSFRNGEVTLLAPGKYLVSIPGKGDQQFLVAEDTEVHGAGVVCGDVRSKVDAPCTAEQLEAAARKGAVPADVEMSEGVASRVTERRAPRQGSGPDSGSSAGSGSGSPKDPSNGSDRSTIEDINDGKGVNGTWFGNVSYLAPGKYTVSGLRGVEQQFFVATDTEIWGYGDICGDENTYEGGQGGIECTEAELEKAAKKGFSAEVGIRNGIATVIRDDH